MYRLLIIVILCAHACSCQCLASELAELLSTYDARIMEVYLEATGLGQRFNALEYVEKSQPLDPELSDYAIASCFSAAERAQYLNVSLMAFVLIDDNSPGMAQIEQSLQLSEMVLSRDIRMLNELVETGKVEQLRDLGARVISVLQKERKLIRDMEGVLFP